MAERGDRPLILRRCVEGDYRTLLDWIPDAAALYLFTGDRLTWPLTLEQFESLAATPRRTDWTLAEASAPRLPLGHVELAFVEEETVRISRVLVSPDQRGRGLGGVLAGLAVKKARDLGATRVELAVIAGNTPAERTYARLGFSASARAPKRPDVRELALDLRGNDE
jgi:RimJ/RimL family protein N-acetyltransferase